MCFCSFFYYYFRILSVWTIKLYPFWKFEKRIDSWSFSKHFDLFQNLSVSFPPYFRRQRDGALPRLFWTGKSRESVSTLPEGSISNDSVIYVFFGCQGICCWVGVPTVTTDFEFGRPQDCPLRFKRIWVIRVVRNGGVLRSPFDRSLMVWD